MKCNRQRFERDFEAVRQFGLLENGGVTRLAFSSEGMQARKWLINAMEEAGLKVSVGPFGNIRGRRVGEDDSTTVMTGSHLDTVPEGGHYDGIIGVLAGLELVRTLSDHNIVTKRSIDVVNFSVEESSRFGMATMGSKAMVDGRFTVDDLKNLHDKDGVTLYNALKNCGYRPDEIASAKIDPDSVYAFIELHIEQGPVLEKSECQIGVVTSIAAPTRFKVTVKGRADHSGNTPMNMRHDALAGAAEIVLAVERIAGKQAGESTVGTVGYMDVTPNAMNVIPGTVELGIDMRDISMGDKDAAVAEVISAMQSIAESRGLSIDYDILTDDKPVAMSEKIISKIEKNASDMNLKYVKMPSGAGHDAMNMANIADAGMIFIPSASGISHNVEEYSDMDDVITGCNLLLKTVLELAQE